MARIRTVDVGGTTRVIVSGSLQAADMGRLEHACAPALTAARSALEIDVRNVTTTDRTATAMLGRLAARGARIIGS